MARIVFDTSSEEDNAIKYATDLYNKTANASETPLQFVQRNWQQKVEFWVRQYRASQKDSRGELFQKATAEDQATIDAILAKYQG